MSINNISFESEEDPKKYKLTVERRIDKKRFSFFGECFKSVDDWSILTYDQGLIQIHKIPKLGEEVNVSTYS